MSKPPRAEAAASDMLPEHDFTHGVRGKHYGAYQRGDTVRIRKTDGTTAVQHFKLEKGAVVLAPDVREYFPGSDTVNEALRTLIRLIVVAYTERGSNIRIINCAKQQSPNGKPMSMLTYHHHSHTRCEFSKAAISLRGDYLLKAYDSPI